jgi:hypothetical protein
MRPSRFAVLLAGLALVVLAGCGMSSQPQALPAGNWAIVTKAATTTSGGTLGGNLIQSGTSVTGVLHSIGFSHCYRPPTPPIMVQTNIPVTGTFENGALHLVSSSVSGQVLTVDATYRSGALNGTYSVQGGCADGERGTVNGQPMPDLSGTWIGIASSGARVVVAWQQQGSATTDGVFSMSGTVNLSNGPACYPSGTMALQAGYSQGGEPMASFVTGNALSVAASDSSSGDPVAIALAGFAHTATSPHAITGTFTLSGGSCAFSPQQITLTRQ